MLLYLRERVSTDGFVVNGCIYSNNQQTGIVVEIILNDSTEGATLPRR